MSLNASPPCPLPCCPVHSNFQHSPQIEQCTQAQARETSCNRKSIAFGGLLHHPDTSSKHLSCGVPTQPAWFCCNSEELITGEINKCYRGRFVEEASTVSHPEKKVVTWVGKFRKKSLTLAVGPVRLCLQQEELCDDTQMVFGRGKSCIL